ncbi:MAG: hypothetical protein IBJ09_13290 [Bacteroidia bacterium]|nr:hypothetical protein [Bacteroidia bacterium]
MEKKRNKDNEKKRKEAKLVEVLPNKSKKTPDMGQKNERSRRITPLAPGTSPKETQKEAEARWDSESPAIVGQPNRVSPYRVDDSSKKKGKRKTPGEARKNSNREQP